MAEADLVSLGGKKEARRSQGSRFSMELGEVLGSGSFGKGKVIDPGESNGAIKGHFWGII